MLKQVRLAAMAATLLAGSAAVANAESNISGVDGGATTSAALRGDGASSYGDAATVWGSSAGMNAYGASMNANGYATESMLDRSRQRGRNNARVTYNN